MVMALLSVKRIEIHTGENFQLTTPGGIENLDTPGVAVFFHGDIGIGAFIRARNDQLVFVMIILVGEIVLYGVIYDDISIQILADTKMMIHTNEINFLEAHIGGQLSSGVHDSLRPADGMRKVICKPEVFVWGAFEIKLVGFVNVDIKIPSEINRNKFIWEFQMIDFFLTTAQHLLIL